MPEKGEIPEELDELLSTLCDGEITPEQARRLEDLATRSSEARRYFVQYLQLQGELLWEAGLAARHKAPVGAEPSPPRPGARTRRGARRPILSRKAARIVWVAAALVVVLGGAAAWVLLESWNLRPGPGGHESVATLRGTSHPEWEENPREAGGQIGRR